MAICRLCKNERQLINAHIIPRAFWRLPPSGEHAAKLLSNTKGVHPRRVRNGVYDNGILCQDCDGRLGTLDQHAAESLLQSRPIDIGIHRHVLSRRYELADASLLRLFIASVAWRASVSTHPYFVHVKLGLYEELIRQTLLNHSNDRRVECVLGEFDNDDVPALDPHATRFDGVRLWLIYADRFIFYVKVDRRPMPNFLNIQNLRKHKVVYSVVRNWEKSKERSVLQNIARANPGAFIKRT
jgi:hypothetical protein